MKTLAGLPWHLFGRSPWDERLTVAMSTDLPARSDVLVIGGGVTGISCALSLAGAGQRVTVVDRAFGGGATVRSGGLIVGDTLVGPVASFDGCAETLRDWIAMQPVDCELRWGGCWQLQRDDRLPPVPIDWQDAGPVRVDGIVPGGTINPARLLSALCQAAVKRGVQLVDGVDITSFAPAANGVVAVSTTSASTFARHVLVAIDASGRAAEGDPWPERFLTIALETDPLRDGVSEAIGWTDRLPFYTNDLPLLWGRTVADGSLVAGRELVPLLGQPDSTLQMEIEAAGARLLARVRGLHPALGDAGIRRVWAGPIARDRAGIPLLVDDSAVPRALWAGGYGGHGLAQAFRLGGLAAQRLTL